MNKNPKITIVISAYNEERKIEDCLKSAKLLADEIILIDNKSQDKTVEIAKKFTSNIYSYQNDPVNLNKNKNEGFRRATGDWIFSLDADERITSELAQEIKRKIKKNEAVAYEMPRKNIIFGKWIEHSIWWPDYSLRLFRKGKAKFKQEHVHERLEVQGKIEKLENHMIHYNYETVSQFIQKLNNNYTESEADYFIKTKKNISWFDAIKWPSEDFFRTFFLKEGYKDGFHGLILSLLQAFYSLVVFAKVWERKEKFSDLTPPNFLPEVQKEFKKTSKNAKYWFYTTMINEGRKKFYFKLKRKIL